MASEQQSWERLLDLTVYAPVGLALTVRDDLPKLVRQGRQAVENRVMLARVIGQFAVQQGQRQLAKRIEAYHEAQRAADLPAPIDVTAVAVDEVGPVTDHVMALDVKPVAPPTGNAPDAASLPIAEYESLAASQVVQRLGTLHPNELEAIRQFEVAHRARRTVLGKIAQLQGD